MCPFVDGAILLLLFSGVDVDISLFQLIYICAVAECSGACGVEGRPHWNSLGLLPCKAQR